MLTTSDTFAAANTFVGIYGSNKSSVITAFCDISLLSGTVSYAGIAAYAFFRIYNNDIVHMLTPFLKKYNISCLFVIEIFIKQYNYITFCIFVNILSKIFELRIRLHFCCEKPLTKNLHRTSGKQQALRLSPAYGGEAQECKFSFLPYPHGLLIRSQQLD